LRICREARLIAGQLSERNIAVRQQSTLFSAEVARGFPPSVFRDLPKL
jgi:hypothetical protein